MAMTLPELLAAWPDLAVLGDADVGIEAVVEDIRDRPAPGRLFVAVTGTRLRWAPFRWPRPVAAGAVGGGRGR